MFAPDPSPFAPIPGTSPSPRGLFIKRCGALTAPPPEGFATSPDQLKFFDGAVEALFRATRAQWHLYIIGNEDAVAFGHLSDLNHELVQTAFLQHLQSFGVQIVRDYTCTDHPEGVRGHQNDSVYMLPNTGPFFHAAHTDGIDLKKSWVVADDTRALVAGWRAGLRTASVATGKGALDGTYDVNAEYHAKDFATLVHDLLASRVTPIR